MGSSSWSNDAYSNLKRSNSTKSTAQIFSNKSTSTEMSPKGLVFRECRDSAAHPESLAVMINLDVTGSMGRIPEVLVREKLGALMDTLISHDIKHASVLFSAIGDSTCDSYPLQVGQFESGATELIKWLTEAVLEGGGGGQKKESYLLAWLLAARHTSIDCFEKRKQKGIMFTIGDEMTWETISASTLKDLMGYTEAQDLSAKDLLAEAQRMYHVFHIHINEGGYKNDPQVLSSWKGLLNERLIVCEDYNHLAELIATTVAVINGVDINTITDSFDSKTAKGVKNALIHVNTSISKQQESVIEL